MPTFDPQKARQVFLKSYRIWVGSLFGLLVGWYLVMCFDGGERESYRDKPPWEYTFEEQIEYEKDFDHSIPFMIVTLFIAAPLSLLWLVLEIVYWVTRTRQVYHGKGITASRHKQHLEVQTPAPIR